MDVTEAEQFGTLASNWLEAEKTEDAAASRAFEDELHARITIEEIRTMRGLDAQTGEFSSAETDRLRTVLQKMWNNAVRRDGAD